MGQTGIRHNSHYGTYTPVGTIRETSSSAEVSAMSLIAMIGLENVEKNDSTVRLGLIEVSRSRSEGSRRDTKFTDKHCHLDYFTAV